MIVGIAGYARSGKDTVAKYLLESYPEMCFPYSFADPIKDACDTIFGWDERHREGELKEIVDPFWGVSPRVAYQTLGTEWGRDLINPDIWVKRAEQIAEKSDKHMLIADVRFPNEAAWLLKQNAILIGVETNRELQKIGGIENHASEAEIGKVLELADYTIYNNTTIDDLYEKIEAVLNMSGFFTPS